MKCTPLSSSHHMAVSNINEWPTNSIDKGVSRHQVDTFPLQWIEVSMAKAMSSYGDETLGRILANVLGQWCCKMFELFITITLRPSSREFGYTADLFSNYSLEQKLEQIIMLSSKIALCSINLGLKQSSRLCGFIWMHSMGGLIYIIFRIGRIACCRLTSVRCRNACKCCSHTSQCYLVLNICIASRIVLIYPLLIFCDWIKHFCSCSPSGSRHLSTWSFKPKS